MIAQKKGRVIFTSLGVGVTGFANISPYSSTKGALEALAKSLWIEYAEDNITFYIMHLPLTRTKSASSLPVPDEFKALPEKVSFGLARHIYSKRFIICHNLNQKLQTLGCYLFPICYFGNVKIKCKHTNRGNAAVTAERSGGKLNKGMEIFLRRQGIPKGHPVSHALRAQGLRPNKVCPGRADR